MLIQRHSDQVQSINGLCISKGTKVGEEAFQSYCAPFTLRERRAKTKLWQPHCFKYLATLLLRCFRPDYRLLPKSWLR